MIDHITIYVSNLSLSRKFYEASFKPFGYSVSFGEEGVFWAFDIGRGMLFEIAQYKGDSAITPCHVAFRASKREEVDAFYEASLAAGGSCNGAPGPRPAYTENYYACFVHDPDRYNIEVMHDLWK